MPDLLSHVLFAYIVATLASVYRHLTKAQVTACLFGAILPDVSKIGLFFDDDFIETIVGPVDFLGWHTLVGVGLSIAFLSLLVDEEERRITAFMLTVGALSHVGLDLLLRTSTGLTNYALFWPVSDYRPKTPGLYLSGDVWVVLVSLLLAVCVYTLKRSNLETLKLTRK